MRPEPTVFIVDDDEAILDALQGALSSAGFRVECFESGESFLSESLLKRAGCLLLDLCMPGMGGLAVQAELEKRNIRMPIVFMTAYGTIRDSVSAVKGGAVDFLEKPVPRQVLIERVRTALNLDRQWHEIQDARSDVIARFENLSPREAEVMALIVEGNSSKQIARLLSISSRTVDAHRARLMEKMQASSLAELGVLFSQCRS